MKKIETLIERKASLADDHGAKALRCCNELLCHKDDLVQIDEDDLEQLFVGDGPVRGVEVSVDGMAQNRIEELNCCLDNELKDISKMNAMAIHIASPKTKELDMEELQQITECLERHGAEAEIVWSYGTHNSDRLCLSGLFQ